MKEVERDEYRDFAAKHREVVIDEVSIPIRGHAATVTATGPDPSYHPETTTVWSFPDRGEWATHKGDYRGNWSPYIPRNLILKYTTVGDLVLDQMCGSGTTLVEARLLGRRGIGVDINPDAVMLSHDRLNFVPTNKLAPESEQGPLQAHRLFVGDARALTALEDSSVDLVATHPPYAGIIRYTGERVEGDLSSLKFDDFLLSIEQVAREALRVLKPGRHCAILIGDTRQHRHYVPISTRVLEAFLRAGFAFKEDIIKIQHNMKRTRENWSGSKYEFYLIMHEHLFVFRKLIPDELRSNYRNSLSWDRTNTSA
jgi:SAM-dependent methyltransferase